MNIITVGLMCMLGQIQFAMDDLPAIQQESDRSVLKHYEGTWDSKFTIESKQPDDEARTFTGVVEGKWVVANKFLQQTGTYQLDENSPPLIIRTLMSFDNKDNRFQYDYFISSGDVERSFGTWNAEAKTMSSKMVRDDLSDSVSIVADFSRENVEHWTIETRHRESGAVTRIVGVNTRRIASDK